MTALPSFLPLRPGPRWLVAGLLLGSSLSAQESDPAKPFRLFVGIDLLLKGEADAGVESYRRVEALKAHQVVLDEPGHPRLPLREAGAFSWKHLPKVSREPVSITEFEQHRAYNLRNDPKMSYLSTQNQMAVYQQEVTDAARLDHNDEEYTQMIRRLVFVYAERDYRERMKWLGIEYTPGGRSGFDFNNPQGAYGSGPVGDALLTSNDDVSDATEAMEEQMVEENRIAGSPDFLDRAQGVDGGEDVLELSFTLSAPEPIAEAYVVVLGKVSQGEEAGVVSFHHPVGAIGPEPRRIKIRKTGFQPGFTIEDVKLHLYAQGEELATSLSDRLVSLTADQAREFLLLSHLAQHSIDTVAPQPVWALPPAALLAAKSGERFDVPVVVSVDADGRILGIHTTEAEARAYLAQIHDAANLRTKSTPSKSTHSLATTVRVSDENSGVARDQTGRLPAHVIAALQDLFFLPALDVGTPVPGVAQVNLAEFFR